MDSTAPEVSVIIVNWHTRDYLIDCIASLLRTTSRTRIEIIVVDNASTDGSQQALREVYPDVTLIQNDDNLGFAKANNRGFKAARGQAVCLVNTDVIAFDGVIDTLWEYLREHPKVGMVGPQTLHRDLKVRENCRRFPSLANTCGDYLWLKRLGIPGLAGRALPLHTYNKTHPADVLSGCFLMVNCQALEEVGGLDEDFFFYGEDTDWGKRFNEAGWQCIYLPDAQAIHFGGGSTAAYPVRYYLTMEKADLMYWRKHKPPLEQLIYKAIKIVYHFISLAAWVPLWVVRPSDRERSILKIKGHATNAVWLLTGWSAI